MRQLALLSALALAFGGCVSAAKYQSAVEETQTLQNKVSAYETELASLRASSAAQAKKSQDQIDALQKQIKEADEQVAILQKSQAEIDKADKDLKKSNELFKNDNERLEKVIADRKASYHKAISTLKAIVEEMSGTEEVLREAAPETVKAPAKPGK